MRRRDNTLSERFGSFLLERASFELREEDLGDLQTRFAASTLNSVASPSAPPAFRSRPRDEEEYQAWKAKYPCLLSNFELFTKQAENKRVAVFLDYDGTLTPIVKNPDRAFMSDQMRAQVRAVAELFPTAIISGRGREKVENFVQLKELYYAGSHGMDIVGPTVDGCVHKGSQLAFQPAAEFEPVMDAVYTLLVERVQGIEGASVEHNKFCVSVHFRNCAPSSWDAVVAAVETTIQEYPQLKATRGRKVLEIRPQVDWDKGRALSHLLSALGLDKGSDVLAIYIGDDRTDEDAFSVLNEQEQGFGILVSSKAKATQAKYTLRDPAEVMAFLTALVDWGCTSSNAWHTLQACTGWHLKANSHKPCRQQDRPCSNGGHCTQQCTSGDLNNHADVEGSIPVTSCSASPSEGGQVAETESVPSACRSSTREPEKPFAAQHHPSALRSPVQSNAQMSPCAVPVGLME